MTTPSKTVPFDALRMGDIVYSELAHEVDPARVRRTYYTILKMNDKSAWLIECDEHGVDRPDTIEFGTLYQNLPRRVPRREVPRNRLNTRLPQ